MNKNILKDRATANRVYIVVDFDGTIVEHRFPEIGPPVPNAIRWLGIFQDFGYKIILNTMRSDGGNRPDNEKLCLTEAVNYLKKNGIELFGINHNPDQDEWTTSPKVYGHFNIDDVNAGCPLIYPQNGNRPYVDWEKVGQEILSRLN
jgi:hypothetical protein